MNQNSNIRRIDELGRIVIPKDIRKKLHIKDNESLEIFIDNEEIHIRKYSSLEDIIDFIKFLVDMGSRVTKNKYIITDRDHIIASTGKIYDDKTLTKTLETLILSENFYKGEYIDFKVADENSISAHVNALPIIIDNDRSGLIIEYNENFKLNDTNAINIFKNLIEDKLNNY